MKKILKLNVILLIGMIVLLPACNDAKYDVISSQVYLSNVGVDWAEKIMIDESGTTVLIQVRTDKKVSSDTKVSIEVSQKALDNYNRVNSTSYEVLPSEFYTLESNSATIPSNSANAMPIGIDLKALTPDLNKTGVTYAVPVSIVSVDNSDLSILESQASYIYVITPTPYADVPVLTRQRGVKMTLKDNAPITVEDFTVEFLVKIDNLALSRNNQILFNAADYAPNAGPEGTGTGDEIFTRFAADGAAGFFDKFQIKNQGQSYDANFSFQNNIWYHIACVNDNTAGTMSIYVNGVLDVRLSNAKNSTTVNSSSPRGFRFCGESDNDSYMRSNVQASEVRFWSVARTEAQIRNNMYGIAPDSNGLIAYWKMNEGTGNTLADATGNGHNAAIFGTAQWNLDQKMEVGR